MRVKERIYLFLLSPITCNCIQDVEFLGGSKLGHDLKDLTNLPISNSIHLPINLDHWAGGLHSGYCFGNVSRSQKVLNTTLYTASLSASHFVPVESKEAVAAVKDITNSTKSLLDLDAFIILSASSDEMFYLMAQIESLSPPRGS